MEQLLSQTGVNIRIRSYLVVVENDISNRTFVLIANKRRVKILEILSTLRKTLSRCLNF